MKKLYIFLFMIFLLSNFISATYIDDMNNGLVSEYKLEESTTDYVDTLGVNNFTSGTDPDRVAGTIDFGQDFDGSTEYIDTPSTNDFALNNISLDFWITPADATDLGVLINYFYFSGSAFGWMLQVNADEELYFIMYCGSGGDADKTWIPLTIGVETHITAVWDGAWTIFQDGDEEAGNVPETDCATTDYTNVDTLRLGRGLPTAFDIYYYKGVVDEVKIFDYSLDEADHDYLDNGGSPDANQQYVIGTGGGGAELVTTLVYPTPSQHYYLSGSNTSKVFNGSLVTTTNNNANCSVWTQIGGFWFPSPTWNNDTRLNTTQHYINYTAITEKNYTVSINCTDGINETETTFWFQVDTTEPTITVFSPLNISTQYENFYLNISYFDKFLFRTNTTIIRNSDNLTIFNNFSGDLSGVDLYYNLTEYINISNGSYPTGNYTLFMEGSDTHTNNKYFENVKLDKKVTKVFDETETEYKFNGHTIKFRLPNEVELDETQISDRLTFQYKIKDNKNKNKEYYKIIEAEHSIIYLKDSPYNYHFILDNKLWYDHEGLTVTRFERISNKIIKIYYLQEKEIEESHSLGGLNEFNKTIMFFVAHTDINVTIFDSDTLVLINQNATLTLDYTLGGVFNYTLENGTIRINDTDSGVVTLTIVTESFNPSSFLDTITIGQLNTFTVYLTNSSATTATILKLIDKNSQPIQNGVIRILKETAPNVFVVESDLTTNFEGETIFEFVRNTVSYKFQIFVNGVLIEETIPTLIFKSQVTIQVATTTDQLASIRDYIDTTSSLTLENISGTLRYTFTYAGTDIKGGKLVVTKRILSSNDIIIVENISNATFGTLTADFIPEPGVLYIGQGFVDTNTSASWFPVDMIDFKSDDIKAIWGQTGLMLAFLILGGIAFLAMKTNPTATLALTLVGVVALTSIGFITGLSYSWLVIIVLIGIIIIAINKT